MTDHLRITADELRKRMQEGEEFTIIDVRNPHAWAEARDMAAGAMRVAKDDLEETLSGIPPERPIVTYCT